MLKKQVYGKNSTASLCGAITDVFHKSGVVDRNENKVLYSLPDTVTGTGPLLSDFHKTFRKTYKGPQKSEAIEKDNFAVGQIAF